MKEILHYIWNLPAEYIVWPIAIFILLTFAISGYVQYKVLQQFND